jgi:MFS family permease
VVEAQALKPQSTGFGKLEQTRWATMANEASSTLTVATIGTTQTLAWGSSYYLPAILADPIAAGLEVPKSLLFSFFLGSLLPEAALGPVIGKAIDRHGGRDVLALSNLVLAAGLVWLALAHNRQRREPNLAFPPLAVPRSPLFRACL